MADRRRIAIVTTGRQDWGILRSAALALRDDARFSLGVWAGGMHLSAGHGRTIDMVRADGAPVTAELEIGNGGAAEESSRMVAAASAAIAKEKPDAMVLLGDRYETLAAGFAASIAGLPIVHLHGGEESEGAIDNAFRHALTKLSHLHLVSHELHAARVRQMGEPPDTVVVVGAAGLDNLYRGDLPDRAALEARVGIPLKDPVVAVTLHGVTLGGEGGAAEAAALSAAMEKVPATYVITQPNSDAGGAAIRAHWTAWGKGRPNVAVVDALGEKNYWGLLKAASAVLGNSSSGIIEAPSLGLPVVNVGDRQRGRLRTAHVIDVAAEPVAIEAALRRALTAETRAALKKTPGHYPAGPAAPRIVEAIAAWKIPQPARKKFHDLAEAAR